MSKNLDIRCESPEDDKAVHDLAFKAFGPGALTRAAYRVREQAPHDPDLAFTGYCDNRLVASVRMTPIAIGETAGLLLGPLVVAPDFKNNGFGRAMVRHALAAAKENGDGLVLLVGDLPYYGPLGFAGVAPGSVKLPAPVDPARVLVAELLPGVADGLAGAVRGIKR